MIEYVSLDDYRIPYWITYQCYLNDQICYLRMKYIERLNCFKIYDNHREIYIEYSKIFNSIKAVHLPTLHHRWQDEVIQMLNTRNRTVELNYRTYV